MACAQDSIGRYIYSGAQGELFEFQDGNGDYGQTLAAENGISDDNILLRINRDFELVDCQVLPWTIYQPDFYLTLGEMQNALVFSNQDSSLLFCCEVWFTLYNPHQMDNRAIALIKYDSHLDMVNVFVLKFFADGSLSVPEMQEFVRPYAFYPNPVKAQLLMQFSPDVQPTQVELYDLQGRLVRTQSKAFESIDMSQLPAGTYTLRVTMEDGKTYSDKVVKE